jgi:hypothetical protein
MHRGIKYLLYHLSNTERSISSRKLWRNKAMRDEFVKRILAEINEKIDTEKAVATSMDLGSDKLFQARILRLEEEKNYLDSFFYGK